MYSQHLKGALDPSQVNLVKCYINKYSTVCELAEGHWTVMSQDD